FFDKNGNRTQRLNFELRCSFFWTKRPALEKHVAHSELLCLATCITEEDKPPACAFCRWLKLKHVPRNLAHAFEFFALFVERAELAVFLEDDDRLVVECVLAEEWTKASWGWGRFGFLGDCYREQQQAEE